MTAAWSAALLLERLTYLAVGLFGVLIGWLVFAVMRWLDEGEVADPPPLRWFGSRIKRERLSGAPLTEEERRWDEEVWGK